MLYHCLVWRHKSDRSRFGSLVKTATKISGRNQTNHSVIYDLQLLRRAGQGVLSCCLLFAVSGHLFVGLKRLYVSFIPSAIDMLNSS